MKFLLLTDPITQKKSITVTALVLCFLLFVISIVLFFIGQLDDFKISMVLLGAVGLFLACYQQKRVKINFTGIEVSDDKSA